MTLCVDYMRNNTSEINALYSGHGWSTPCLDINNNDDYARDSGRVHSDRDALCKLRIRGRRKRTTFSKAQLWELERSFSLTHYPDVKMKEFIASLTGLPESKIQVWFQNRRARYFKSKKPREAATPSPDFSVPQFPYMSTTSSTTSSSPPAFPSTSYPATLSSNPLPSSPRLAPSSKVSTMLRSQAMSLPAPNSPIPADQATGCFLDRLGFQDYSPECFSANEALLKNKAFGTWNLSEDFESFFGYEQQECLPEESRCGAAGLAMSIPAAIEELQYQSFADGGRQQTVGLNEFSEIYFQDLGDFSLSELDVSTALIDYILG